MPGARVEKSPIPTEPLHDVSTWIHVDTGKLNSKNRKRFEKRKAAIIAYFTTTNPIEEIARCYGLPVPLLQQWADKSLMIHEDGEPWGFRALVPGVTVVDHSATIPAHETTDTLDEPVSIHDETTDTLEEPVSIHDEITGVLEEPVSIHDETADVLEEPVSIHDETADVLEEPVSIHDEISSVSNETIIGDEAKNAAISEESLAEQNDLNEFIAEADGPSHTSEIAIIEEENETEADTDKRKAITHSLANAPMATQTPETPIPPFLEEMEDEEEAQNIPEVVEPSIPFPPLIARGALSSGEEMRGNGVIGEREDGLKLSLHSTNGTAHFAAKKVSYRRKVHKRWIREDRLQHKRKRMLTIVSLVAVALILIGVAVPLGTGLAAYSAYNNIRSVAYDGIDHLLAVKDLFATVKSDPMGALNVGKLKQAQGNFQAAESDFLQLQQLVNRSDVKSAIQQFAPQYSNYLGTAQHLI